MGGSKHDRRSSSVRTYVRVVAGRTPLARSIHFVVVGDVAGSFAAAVAAAVVAAAAAVAAVAALVQVGEVKKLAPSSLADIAKEIATDADKFTISFPQDLKVETKATALVALLVVDLLFFEVTYSCMPSRPL